jgi:CubicO group peptidase (beta-lactamase class C family)
MEARTGQPFAVLMKKYVLDPLDMDETVPDAAGSPISNRASLYSIDKTGVANAPLDDLSSRWPSGGYLSTSDDLATLGRSILAPGLLNQQSLAIMLTPQHLQTGAATFVGIGWRISVDSTGRTYYHHGGSSNGGEAFVLVYPKEQVVVAFAANASKGNTEPEARAIAAWFLR